MSQYEITRRNALQLITAAGGAAFLPGKELLAQSSPWIKGSCSV